MEKLIILLALNLFFAILNHKAKNYKTSAISFIVVGTILTRVIDAILNNLN